MQLFKCVNAAATVATVIATAPNSLNINQTTSIQSVAKTLVAGVMSYYNGTKTTFVDLPKPYYWWECAALLGALLDYSHNTGDASYDETIATGLLANTGPNFDYMLPKHYGDEGNDDLAFWGFAVMSAAERNFPQPNISMPSWLDMAGNIWASLESRWTVNPNCSGGLLWQIFESNPNRLVYKNSVSNGGFFMLSARLARATGKETYLQWANKVWDWSVGVGMIDESFEVLDGASTEQNCTKMNPVTFSYSHGIYLYGAAVMANYTGDAVWLKHTESLLSAASSFFGPFENSTNIMWEHACEGANTCNTDMKSFKGYLSRFMWASTLMVSSLGPTVQKLLGTSALAAAAACTGGTDGATCGEKWYVGGFDGQVGLGQQMSALETVQGLLVARAAAPYQGKDIRVVREFDTWPNPTDENTPFTSNAT